MNFKSSSRRRGAFTLVELMVSMALILFIMTILAMAFQASLETFGRLRAVGQLADKLRLATNMIRADLAADHFENRRRLSDRDFWTTLYSAPNGGQTPVREGFFRVLLRDLNDRNNKNPNITSTDEGVDPDGIDPNNKNHSFSSVPGAFSPKTGHTQIPYHILDFTVRLKGNSRDDFFIARLPAASPLLFSNGKYARTNFYQSISGPDQDSRYQDNPVNGSVATYNGEWAEIAYYLVPTVMIDGSPIPFNKDEALDIGPNDTPLYALYRSQFVVVPDSKNLNFPASDTQNNPQPPKNQQRLLVAPDFASLNASTPDYTEFSCNSLPDPKNPAINTWQFNNPTDLAQGNRTFDPTNPQAARTWDSTGQTTRGATLVLPDVISFNVQVLKYTLPTGPMDMDFGDVPQDPVNWNDTRNFDTYVPPPPNNQTPLTPPGYIIKAIQINLRIWDLKSQQTRQVTIVQEM